MKRVITILAIGLALVACGDTSNEKGWELTQNNENQNNENNVNNVNNQNNTKRPVDQPELVGMFVSGHLGNYSDCPEMGYDPASAGADLAPGEPGACADGESCPNVLNCEPAQLTIRLENVGEADALGLRVALIELFDLDGSLLAELPVTAVTAAETGESASETLAVDEATMLRVDFAGPARPWDLFSTDEGGFRGYSGTVKVRIEFDNHEPVIIESSELYALDSIAT